jgi:hypothetical protein
VPHAHRQPIYGHDVLAVALAELVRLDHEGLSGGIAIVTVDDYHLLSILIEKDSVL